MLSVLEFGFIIPFQLDQYLCCYDVSSLKEIWNIETLNIRILKTLKYICFRYNEFDVEKFDKILLEPSRFFFTK